MPRKDQGWITFQVPEADRQRLERYCERMQRSKTDVLRELVRTLAPAAPDDLRGSVGAASQLENRDAARTVKDPQSRSEGPPPHSDREIHAMRVSARNVFPAVVRAVRLGSVNAEIVLEIPPAVEAVAMITRSSAEALHLKVGRPAYALVKSSDVMVAVDD